MTTTRVKSLPDLPVPVSESDKIKVRLFGDTNRTECLFLYADLYEDGSIKEVTVLDPRYRHMRTVRPDAISWPSPLPAPKRTPTGRLKKVKPRKFKAACFHYERDDYGCLDTENCVHVKDSRKKTHCGCCGVKI